MSFDIKSFHLDVGGHFCFPAKLGDSDRLSPTVYNLLHQRPFTVRAQFYCYECHKRVNVRFSSSELISESSHRCTERIESRIEIPIFSGRAFVGNWTDECRFFYPIIDIVESLEVGRGRVQKAYESVGVALLKVGDPNAEFYFGDGPNPLDDMLISPVRPYGNRVGLNLTGSGTLIVVDEGALMNHLNNGGNLPLSGEVIELPVGIYRFESFSDPMARGALSWRITKSA